MHAWVKHVFCYKTHLFPMFKVKYTLTNVMFWFKTQCERMIHVCFGNSMLKGTWAPKYIIEGS